MSTFPAPPDVEALVVAYLAGLFPSATVATRRPYGVDWADAPETIIRPQVIGGDTPRAVVLDTAVLSVEVWAPGEAAAATLAGEVSGALSAWKSPPVYQCEAARPTSYPDPETAFPRYLITATVTSRLINT